MFGIVFGFCIDKSNSAFGLHSIWVDSQASQRSGKIRSFWCDKVSDMEELKAMSTDAKYDK